MKKDCQGNIDVKTFIVIVSIVGFMDVNHMNAKLDLINEQVEE